jgi:hypothetical protein
MRERLGVRVWEAGKEVPAGPPIEDATIGDVALSLDGRMLAAATTDGLVLWDVRTALPLTEPLFADGDLSDVVEDLSPQRRVTRPAATLPPRPDGTWSAVLRRPDRRGGIGPCLNHGG